MPNSWSSDIKSSMYTLRVCLKRFVSEQYRVRIWIRIRIRIRIIFLDKIENELCEIQKGSLKWTGVEEGIEGITVINGKSFLCGRRGEQLIEGQLRQITPNFSQIKAIESDQRFKGDLSQVEVTESIELFKSISPPS